MKIMQSQYEGIPIKVYKAYYRDTFIAIAKKKERLVTYMEFHRNLNPKEYQIEKETMLDSTYYINYEDSRLVPFFGYYLPQIDISCIDEDQRSAKLEFQDTVNKMTYMLYLFNRTKGMNEIHNQGVDYLREVLSVINDDKNMKKLEQSHALSHPLVIMGMREYLETMKNYQELKDQDRHLRDICREEISW